MLESVIIAAETCALDANEDFMVYSAMIRYAGILLLMEAIGIVTLTVMIMRPKLAFLMSLLLALSAILAAGFSIYTALSTLHKLRGTSRDENAPKLRFIAGTAYFMLVLAFGPLISQMLLLHWDGNPWTLLSDDI